MYKYDFYLRDYRSKTGHLDLLHHGAYKALLDAYYDSERPLPGNPTGYFGLCHRLAGAFTVEEQTAVDDVLKAFFTVGEDGCFHNKMADEQIEKYRQFVVLQRKKGILGGRPRKPDGLSPANPTGNPQGNPNETLSPTPTKKRTALVKNRFGDTLLLSPEEVEKLREKLNGDFDAFMSFWDLALGVKNYGYASHYKAALKWGIRAYFEDKAKTNTRPQGGSRSVCL